MEKGCAWIFWQFDNEGQEAAINKKNCKSIRAKFRRREFQPRYPTLPPIWVFPKKIGVVNPPKWMVYLMENPIKMDDHWGYHWGWNPFIHSLFGWNRNPCFSPPGFHREKTWVDSAGKSPTSMFILEHLGVFSQSLSERCDCFFSASYPDKCGFIIASVTCCCFLTHWKGNPLYPKFAPTWDFKSAGTVLLVKVPLLWQNDACNDARRVHLFATFVSLIELKMKDQLFERSYSWPRRTCSVWMTCACHLGRLPLWVLKFLQKMRDGPADCIGAAARRHRTRGSLQLDWNCLEKIKLPTICLQNMEGVVIA